MNDQRLLWCIFIRHVRQLSTVTTETYAACKFLTVQSCPSYKTKALFHRAGVWSLCYDTGPITAEDVHRVLPYNDTIDYVEVTGKDLTAAFENAVADYDAAGYKPSGKFLQLAGNL